MSGRRIKKFCKQYRRKLKSVDQDSKAEVIADRRRRRKRRKTQAYCVKDVPGIKNVRGYLKMKEVSVADNVEYLGIDIRNQAKNLGTPENQRKKCAQRVGFCGKNQGIQ